MPLMIMNSSSVDETRAQIDSNVAEFGPQLKKSNNVGLIIDGNVCECKMSFLFPNLLYNLISADTIFGITLSLY